jgi:membrane protein DedA with SNARE-associated domain
MELERLIADHGVWFYVLTFVWTFLEGETFVLCAGILAAQGLIDAPLLLACAWLGSFSGDQLYFWTGRHFGPRLMQRFPRWRGGVDLALSFLKRFNTGFILTFRFIYGVRNISSFALGMSGLGWQRFFVLNFAAAGIWATSFMMAGYLFGAAMREVLGEYVRSFSLAMLGVFLLVGGGMYLLHRAQKRRLMTPPAAASAVAPPP